MKKIISSFFLMLFFLLWANFSSAAPPAVPASPSVSAPLSSVNQSLDIAVKDTTVKLQNIAVKWLSAFILLQFFITNFAALKSGGEIDSVFYKMIGSLAWFSFCFYIMEKGAKLLSDVLGGFFTTASGIAGGGGNFDTANILNKGCESAAILITNVTDAASYVSLIPAAILAGLLGLIIMGVSALIAFKIFIIKIEVMLLVMMAPLSFAFLGLNTMKEQGIAPFKSSISLLYRIILLAVIMSAMGSVGNNLNEVINSVDKESFVSGMWQSLFGAVVAFALLGYLAYKSDSMAANLSSGSTSLGTGDVAGAVGGAVAGAMAGAAVVTAASGGKSMSDVMKSMMGSSGSNGGASDASGGRGTGGSRGAPIDQAPANPNMSTSGAAGVSTSAPKLQETGGKSGPSAAETAAGVGANTPVSTQQSLDTQTTAGRAASNSQEIVDSSPAKTAAGGDNAGSGATAVGGGGAVFDSVTAANGSPEAALAAQSAANAGKSSADVAQAAMKATPGGDFPLGGSAHKQMTDAVNKGMSAPSSAKTAAGGDNAGSGATAGIGGASNKMEDTMARIADHLEKQGAPKKPGFTDHLKEIGHQATHEKANVSVSINPNIE